MIISRRTHPLVKELRELRDKPHKDWLFLEGPKLVEETVKASIGIKTLVLSDKVKAGKDLLGSAKASAQTTFTVSDSIFRSISDVEEPQGILAIARRPAWSWEQILRRFPGPVIILDGIQNPGNLAAILRTAEASGTAGVITTPGTARLNSPKALRGAMGSSLRVPSLEHVAIKEIAERLRETGCLIYGTLVDRHEELSASLNYYDVDWTQAAGIVFGHEGGGLSEGWKEYLNRNLTVPMEYPVESLNVSAAAAIILYDAYRQRQQGGWHGNRM